MKWIFCIIIVSLGCQQQELPLQPTFEADVSPMLQNKCGPCHTTDSEGGLNHALVYADTQFDSEFCDNKKVYACLLELVETGEMPENANCSGDPVADEDNSMCLSADEQELLRRWVANGGPQ